MEELERRSEQFLGELIVWLPRLLGALLLLLIGSFIARAISSLLQRFFDRLNINGHIHQVFGGSFIKKAIPDPNQLLARITYWIIMLGVFSLAATVLELETVNRFISAIYGYLPQVLAAALIFIVGSAVAAGVTSLVRDTMGDTHTGKLLESIAPAIVMALTTFMILDQLGIASTIVTITYAALIGSIALGSALAFGLGGRDVAAKMLEDVYRKGKASSGQIKSDFAKGQARAKHLHDDRGQASAK